MGEKATHIILKEADLALAGFTIPRTYVLASDALESILKLNNTSITDASKRGASLTRLPPFIDDALALISTRFNGSPIAVRSSGPGDANGTGVYESKVVPPTAARLSAGLLQVIESYFSDHARAYRSGAELGDDVGVLLQPVLGIARENYFSSTLSGFAFTTAKHGEPMVNVVFGFGGGVQSRGGIRIDADTVALYDGDLHAILAARGRELDLFLAHHQRNSLQLDTEKVSGLAFRYGKKGLSDGAMVESRLTLCPDSITAIRKHSLHDLCGRLKTLELAIGAPQYVEWVASVVGDALQFGVVQIADVPAPLIPAIPSDVRPMYVGHTVSGQGEKRCDALVYCPTREALPELLKYNKAAAERPFVLIYPASLTSQAHFGSAQLGLQHYSNADVLLEIPDEEHARDPIAHLAGEMSSLQKLFGVCSTCVAGLPKKIFETDGDASYRNLRVAQVPTVSYGSLIEDTLRVFLARNL